MILFCFENTDKTNRVDSDWCTRQKQDKNKNIIIRPSEELTNPERLLVGTREMTLAGTAMTLSKKLKGKHSVGKPSVNQPLEMKSIRHSK
jgi:hypothetical protein